MRRLIQDEIEDLIAEKLLSGLISKGSVVKIGISSGNLKLTVVKE